MDIFPIPGFVFWTFVGEKVYNISTNLAIDGITSFTILQLAYLILIEPDDNHAAASFYCTYRYKQVYL